MILSDPASQPLADRAICLYWGDMRRMCGTGIYISFKGPDMGTPPATVGLEPGQVLSPIYKGAGG